MRAGAVTPATLADSGRSVYDSGWRSMRAGAVTPATHDPVPHAQPQLGTLNEGRGCNPGDTGGEQHMLTRHQRSMRAGAVTPATPGAQVHLGEHVDGAQ